VPHPPRETLREETPVGADPASLDNATESVTLETLAADIDDLKAQLAIIVEWLETLEQRLGDED
jgi:hypothetical protein